LTSAPVGDSAPGDEPTPLTRREWLAAHWSTTTRQRVAVVIAVVAIVVATFIASSRLLRFFFDYLDVVAYSGSSLPAGSVPAGLWCRSQASAP